MTSVDTRAETDHGDPKGAQTDSINGLNKHWQAKHRERDRAVKKRLLADYTAPSAADRVLLGLASHDTAIAELIGDAQVLLASRVVAFVDSPKLALALARALGEATSCRNAATQRVEALLQTVTTTRAQRDLASPKHNPSHLRRVA